MKEIEQSLIREIAQDYMLRGMDYSTALYHAGRMARIIVSRMESGAPEEYWTVGMGLSLKSIVKAVTKPFKQVGKAVSRAVKDVGHGVEHFAQQIEKHVIRPVAHWQYLSIAANLVPGYGQVLSGLISAAQTARSVYVNVKDQKKAMREFEQKAGLAYRQYQDEALKRGLQPMSFSQFKDAISQQAF